MRTGGRSQAAWGASGDAPRAQPRAHPTGRAGRAPASARAHGALNAPTRSQRRVPLGTWLAMRGAVGDRGATPSPIAVRVTTREWRECELCEMKSCCHILETLEDSLATRKPAAAAASSRHAHTTTTSYAQARRTHITAPADTSAYTHELTTQNAGKIARCHRRTTEFPRRARRGRSCSLKARMVARCTLAANSDVVEADG